MPTQDSPAALGNHGRRVLLGFLAVDVLRVTHPLAHQAGKKGLIPNLDMKPDLSSFRLSCFPPWLANRRFSAVLISIEAFCAKSQAGGVFINRGDRA